MGARAVVILLLSLLVAGCGGGGGGGPAPAPPGITRAEAARFLRQATFGPTAAEIDRVVAMGYEAWLDEQLALPATLQQPVLESLGTPDDQTGQADRIDAWFRAALRGPDQLRQRVAFALSEIWVVSEQSGLFNQPYGLANYYDLLARGAFGNYRQLMEDATLHPAMGLYLSMLGNRKPDVALNIRPDENYARELMQLFTIGLVELEPDGTVRRDGLGHPLPTYDQAVIEGFAHAWTGWTFGGSASFLAPSFDFLQPMTAFPEYHDTGPKQVLGGEVLPGGQTPAQDLEAALDNIFAHPNVGPFVGRQLIQRLTASNPSPGYVARVAAVFADNGRGVRGDLRAVVRAILLDPEARTAPADDAAGKAVEPLIRLTHLWRAYGASAANGRYEVAAPAFFFEQGPLQARSVFNFFQPGYAPPGEIRERGLVAPELQIINELSTALTADLFTVAIALWNSANPGLEPGQVAIDISAELALAGNPAALVDLAADKLLGGDISPELRDEAIAMANRQAADAPAARVVEVLFLLTTSPEFAVLR